MSTSSYFIKPITSFLKESNTPGKYFYPDQENQENEFISQKSSKIPFSITKMIPPIVDENILKSQQKTMFNLSEQIRQLKINNESLARGNAGLEKDLEDKNNTLSYYEDVLLRLYKEKPLKTQTSGLKHRIGTQEQKEIEELIENITLKKQISKENKEEESKQEKSMVTRTIDFFSKKKENSTQTDGLPLSINLENIVNENYSPRYSPKNSPRHSPKHRSPQSPKGKNEGFSQKVNKPAQNKDLRELSLFGNDKDYQEKVKENIGKIRLDINNVFKNFKDISRGISCENISFAMCFPYFLEDGDEEIVQFRDFHMYNMRYNISFWSFFHKTIEFFLKCFRFVFEFKWFFPCFNEKNNTYYSHQDLFNKFNRIFSCRLEKTFNKSFGTPENYEKEVFLAFLSLYDDIPSNNKNFFSGSYQQEDWKMNRFSTKRIQKPKSKVVNLETKYLIYLICEKVKDHAKMYKLFFSKTRTLYLFFNFDSSNKELLIKYFKKSRDFFISLDEELIELIKLEPFDANNVPLSLKIRLNQISFDEIHNINTNRVVPIKENPKKPLDSPKNQGFNKLLEKKEIDKENKVILPIPVDMEQKSQEEPQNIDLERVQLRSEAFYQQKKTFLIKNWFKIQESLDFSKFLFVLKEKLIMSRDYKLTLKEMDFYEKFIEKFAFYISNKILINYEDSETRIFDLNFNDPDFFKMLKKLDFNEISNILKKTLNILQTENKTFAVFNNYWVKNKKNAGKMWLRANDELIPLDFVENYLFLPKILAERNIFHNIAIYFSYKPNFLLENEGFALLYDEKQLNRQIIKEIIQISDLNVLKTTKCFFDIFMFKEFVENNAFSLFKDHFNIFSMKPQSKLFSFYEKLHKFVGYNTTFLLAFCDFIAILMKIMIIPGIVSFILMSYYERSSVEYKATIMVYSFLIILLYCVITKISLRYLSQYKANMGIIQVQIDKRKKIVYKDFHNEKSELLIPIREGFMSKCKYYSKKLFIFLEMMILFLGLFAIKTYITYGFNLLKVEWVKNQTIQMYNFYFDINQFLPDLFDFMLIPIFMTIFKKFIFQPSFNYYIINEKAFKETLCIFFRVFCEFSCFFQIIFIYPSIENCVKNDCLSMCQQAYKNMLVIYCFYKISYWIYCYVKAQRVFDLRKSFESTLIANRAYKANANVKNINEIKKESVINNTESNEKKTEELDLSPDKKDGRMKKFVYLSDITNKIMLNFKMDSLFYKKTFIEKTYEIIIDTMVFMLYHIAFSSMFSLDGIYFALLFYFECFFNKYKVIFLYKTFFSNEKNDFSHLKFCFFFIIVCGIIFNMGLLAFLYETFFDFQSIGAFFALVCGIIAICFFIFFVFSDLYEETKEKLIEHRQIFNRFFNFLK